MFHVLDPAELDFPFRQTTLFKGLEGMPEVLTDPHALRRAYLAEVGAFLDELKKGCRVDIDYVPLRTDDDLDVALSSYLASRSSGSVTAGGTPLAIKQAITAYEDQSQRKT